ncbi:E3 SUMO-protein ligase KIAA1586-like [Pituophis catenifer annectens]|uniref:E3 SUMO-protein ligase KIAA1586-like n=1 Tax=Pituophis catenifer annectens TaxID=94852 RepID=UPI003993234D
MDKISERQFGTTSKMFKTVYSLAKACRPISSIEELIELQTENGVDLGVGLHSRPTVVKIVECIANEIKTQMFSSIIARNLKICLITDEASTVSCKPVLIVFLKVEDSEDPPTIFVELVELKKQDAETICSAVFESLHKVGFTRDYLQKNAFCSDGASVMLGRKTGVSTRIANEFPNIIIWHCLNHRLQLVLDDAIKGIKQVNHFKIFIDKICSIFQQSNKNQIELDKTSEELEINIIRIGRVFGPRWAACSLPATIAVWRAYPVRHQHFHRNAKYSGMAARLENKHFLNDLALMIDILEEISLLSTALQTRNTDIIKAEKLVRRSIKAFELLTKGKGPYKRKVEGLITSETFRNINFIENHRFVGLHRERLLQSIIKNLQKRLMDCEHLKTGNQLQNTTNKLQFLQFLVPEYRDFEEIVVPWAAAEEQLCTFSDFFNYNIDINDYRDFVENVLKDSKRYAIPDSIKKAKDIVRTIAVSSAEAERVFLKMNLICSDSRSRLAVSNLTNLMTISVTGLPLPKWDPIPAVKKWFREHHRSANDPRIKCKKSGSEENATEIAMWKHLKAKDD